VSAAIAALGDAYTDADSLETICQIHVDELNGADTHELVYHIRGEATPSGQALGSCTCRKHKQLSIWDFWLALEWKQLDAQLGFLAGLGMERARRSPEAQYLFATPSFVVAQTALTPMPTLCHQPKRHTFGLKMLTPIGIALAVDRKVTARWCFQCSRPFWYTTKLVLYW
jgi:hypothetical protein